MSVTCGQNDRIVSYLTESKSIDGMVVCIFAMGKCNRYLFPRFQYKERNLGGNEIVVGNTGSPAYYFLAPKFQLIWSL